MQRVRTLPAHLLAIALLAVLAFAAGAAGVTNKHKAPRVPAPPTSRGVNMAIDDSLFQTVPLGTNQPSACSPADPGEPWRGVLVRAPSQVTIPAHSLHHTPLTLPLCGTWRLEAAKLYRQGPIVLVVTDQRSGQVYRGEVVDPDSNLLVPPPWSEPLDPQLLTDLVISGYFNVNVASYVPVPAVPAVYDIVAEYGKAQSNKVRVAVVAQP